MARNYQQHGATLTYTNAGDDIAAGDVVVMADTVGVALVDIPVGESGSVAIEGTFRLPKATGTAWEQGARLDWDASAGAFTIGGGDVAGCAIAAEPAASDDAVGAVKLAGAGLDSKPGEVSWDDVQDKPASFPPSSHTHPIAQVDGLQAALDSKLEEVSWNDVQGKPANFPPSSHTHSIAQVDGLQSALDSKLGQVTQADIAPLVAGVSPIADPAEATVEDVANAFNALLAALGGPTE